MSGFDLGSLAAVQGKIGEAEQLFRASAGLEEARKANDQYIGDMSALALFDLRYRNKPDAALAILSEALAKHSARVD